ncbi:hypothetical protein HRI96_09115 [Treponema parvum]|uniref:Uncharacterized protein n=1 Tax=Treponema parvum TaxID=138851 RepID=A0A975ID32_9SPIR|nr:hypothetical protein [Treponema parvum]QTQ12343.1 hypothetical protein HRI96_09115 [Treponema parvum]
MFEIELKAHIFERHDFYWRLSPEKSSAKTLEILWADSGFTLTDKKNSI